MPRRTVIPKLNFPHLVKEPAQHQMLRLHIRSAVRCPFVLVTSAATQVIIRNSLPPPVTVTKFHDRTHKSSHSARHLHHTNVTDVPSMTRSLHFTSPHFTSLFRQNFTNNFSPYVPNPRVTTSGILRHSEAAPPFPYHLQYRSVATEGTNCVPAGGQWRTEGGLGCSNPPPKFRRPSKSVPKLNPTVKTVKNC